MPNVNFVHLVGHAGRDAEVKTASTGNKVVNFSLAVTKKWKGKDGTMNERTDWANIVAFGYAAEAASDVRKGDTVSVTGSLKNNEYEKDGVKKKSTAVVADAIVIQPKGEKHYAHPFEQRTASPETGSASDDDLPF